MTGIVKTPADALEVAAEHIRAGWTQHQTWEMVDGKRHCCAEGALWFACGASVGLDGADFSIDPKGYNLWFTTVDELELFIGTEVSSWNDSLGQTQERVADTMLRLAKELRNNESS